MQRRSGPMPPGVAGDFALAQLSGGRVILGSGPFERSAAPAPSGVSFYSNDFSLSHAEPWRIPAAWQELTMDELAAGEAADPVPPLHWEEPSLEAFKLAFAEIAERLRKGDLVKAVPAVTERSPLPAGTEPAAALLRSARDPGNSSWLYGFSEGGAGFVGLTPERLFEMNAQHLQTMALAGTAASGLDESFSRDAKEQCEHRLVVEALRRRLAVFGEVAEGEREILDVGGMIHFVSRFQVNLQSTPAIDDVIAALHPTPAVGVVPRSKGSLDYLHALRSKLGVPSAFGAPFGVKYDDRFEAFVAIRGVFWEKDEAFLPSGCGLVGASELDSEWAELELKRQWVKAAFGLA